MMSPAPEDYRLYEPDQIIKKGRLGLLSEIAREMLGNHWLIAQLFRREMVSLYKQSFLGALWILAVPILSVGTFVILQKSGVLTVGDMDAPYPVYGMLGLILWQFFAQGLVSGTQSLVKAGSLIVKINFSRKALLIAALGQAMVALVVQLVLWAGVCAYYKFIPSPFVLLLPLLVVPLAVLTLGLASLLSILNGIMRDVGNMVSVVLSFIMFLTPILYVAPADGFLFQLNRYNILNYLIASVRDMVLWGSVANGPKIVAASAIAIITGLACLVLFHIAEPRVTERI